MAAATGITAFLLVWVLPAFVAAFLARRKRRSFGGFLALGLLINGVIAVAVALLVRDRTPPEDPVDRLKRLEVARDQGTITPEQFEAEAATVHPRSSYRM